MNSITQPSFWEAYRKLPADVRRAARAAYARFSRDPFRRGLWFKRLKGYDDLWSVRINDSYRAVCVRDGGTVHWFWIGSHAEYDRDFA